MESELRCVFSTCIVLILS